MNEWLNNIVFRIDNFDITWGNLLAEGLTLAVLLGTYFFILFRFLPIFFAKEAVDKAARARIRRFLLYCLLLAVFVSIELSTGIDYVLYQGTNLNIRLSGVLRVLLLIQIVRLLDTIASRLLLNIYQEFRQQQDTKVSVYMPQRDRRSTRSMVRSLIYTLALLLIVQVFNINYTLFGVPLKDGSAYQVKISSLLLAISIILVAQLINWVLIQIVLYRYYRRRDVDVGRQYAVNRLLIYFIYIAAALIALQSLGINVTLIWGGLAALALGVGLGLQQTFNDLASGIILLFERTVAVGDIVQLDGVVGRVQKIGLRTSVVETRERITLIVPNSKLVTEKIVNWSHADNIARFSVAVDVAYGSDTTLVKKLLLSVAEAHSAVLQEPEPFVRFTNFGSSSLNFELFFWSNELFPIENVKSDLRFEIDRVFRAYNITIPFPQHDVWFRNAPNNAG